ncbi:uncharacterized protein LOC100272388 [Zea mays]|uniref:DUF674 family protein n=1 Tax=Zea mays TaxID=4577 RepID=B4FNC1_MAIZE|nr:uncharacterized protein LOC100272388 [Zea mays]ACF83614.1 unknown [Zea mays]|eukprot:NP_001140340.1 uncharacterized protein LOC100272388 [Zea mays]
MAKPEGPTIGVKLFVDKEKKKVLFAESDKEFVDVLFSFLTMPLGTIVRLLDKQSQMGCLDQLYKSVEDLNLEYFQTSACKAMLLKPLNAASGHCCRLKINVDGSFPRVVYVCKDTSCSALSDNAFSSFPGTVCKCGCLKFIVTDDLQVAPASTSLMMSFFEKFGVLDPAVLEQQVLQFSSEKIKCLLKRLLTSKQPLTDHYFEALVPQDDASLEALVQNLHPKQENEDQEMPGNQKIRVLQTKDNSALLYDEVGVDFVDSLFGLLSIPLGSAIKLYCQCSAKGCLGNAYRSIDGSVKEFVREECQSLLLDPKSLWFSGCNRSHEFAYSLRCNEVFCANKVKSIKLCEANPKRQNGGSGQTNFVVKEIKLKVMELQRAVLVLSRNILSSVLLHPKKTKKLHHYRRM